jgi:hypothetical protein
MLFLTHAELAALTGYKIPTYQVRWLARNGVRHWVNKAGRPVVPKSAIDGGAQQDNDGGFQLGKVA